MESLTRISAGAAVITLTVMSWIAVVWAISPFIAEAVTALHRAYGY